MRIEVGRLLDPCLYALAIEARVLKVLWRGQIQLRPELPVEVGDASLCAVGRNGEKIADHDGCGDQSDELACSNRKVEYGLITFRDFSHSTGLCIHPDDGRAALFRDAVE